MIIIDVEIKKAILGRNEKPIEGIEYCDGWRDFANMGISCVCTYDIVSNLSRVFLEENFVTLCGYLSDKYTAGFNTNRFDRPLLAANGVQVNPETHYDILEHIWLAQGLDPDKFNPRTHGGWGLDAVCQATLGIAKTGHGAAAPVWWQQGKRGKIIDYCLNDVWMEGRLLSHILEGLPIWNRGSHDDRMGLKVARPGWTVGGARDAALSEIAKPYVEHLKKAFAAVPDRTGIDTVAPVREAQQKEFGKAAEKIDRDVMSGGLGIIR